MKRVCYFVVLLILFLGISSAFGYFGEFGDGTSPSDTVRLSFCTWDSSGHGANADTVEWKRFWHGVLIDSTRDAANTYLIRPGMYSLPKRAYSPGKYGEYEVYFWFNYIDKDQRVYQSDSYTVRQGDLKPMAVNVSADHVKASNYFYAPNAAYYDSTPTQRSTGEALHPDVVYDPNGWKGHKFWMAFTPYGDEPEDPQILVSDDGRNWKFPRAYYVYVDSAEDSRMFADPDLIWDARQDTLWCFYTRLIQTVEETTYVCQKASVDGVTWGGRILTWKNTGLGIMNPSLVYDPSSAQYRMYYVRGFTGTSKLYYKDNPILGGTGWSSADTIPCIIPHIAGKKLWHLNVNKVWDGYHGFFLECDSTTSGSEGVLYFAKSSDGITWTIDDIPLLTKGKAAAWDSNWVYQASAVPLTRNGILTYGLWYSAQGGLNNEFHIGYTELKFLADLNNIYAIKNKTEDLSNFLGAESGDTIVFYPTDGSANKDSCAVFHNGWKRSLSFGHSNNPAVIDTTFTR